MRSLGAFLFVSRRLAAFSTRLHQGVSEGSSLCLRERPVPEIAGILPEVSWLFFKAVRAGLAVKHPGKTVSADRRLGVCKASSIPSRPPGHYSRVEKRSYFPIRRYTPTRRPADTLPLAEPSGAKAGAFAYACPKISGGGKKAPACGQDTRRLGTRGLEIQAKTD